jgi:transcriptional regulator with XRE-family HTH domain
MDFNKASVGKVIKTLRKEKNLSQEVLSGFACIARSHLAMIESGAKQANFETIWKLAYALEIPPHKLVELIENETKNAKK